LKCSVDQSSRKRPVMTGRNGSVAPPIAWTAPASDPSSTSCRCGVLPASLSSCRCSAAQSGCCPILTGKT